VPTSGIVLFNLSGKVTGAALPVDGGYSSFMA